MTSEQKRSAEFEATMRPSKLAKVDDSQVTYEVVVPSWVPETKSGLKGTMIGHLIGVGGKKQKGIRSMTGCHVHIFDQQTPMKIAFTSTSVQKVRSAFGMIKKSLLEYLSDENSEKRLIYELAMSASGSHNIHETSNGLLLQRHNGVKRWLVVFELPGKAREECIDHHGKFLLALDLKDTKCRVELFGNAFKRPLKYVAPYVLISGEEEANVNVAITRVMKEMRKHQQRCSCLPKW